MEIDLQGRILSVNDNFLDVLQYRPENVIGRTLEELIPQTFHRDPNYQKMRQGLANGEHFNGAYRLLRGDGREAWLRCIWQPIRDGRGQIQSIVVCANDLTRTIETAKEHEGLINALLRSTAVIEFNLKGEVLNANHRFLDAMGYRLEQIKGKHHSVFCEPEESSSPRTGSSGPSCCAASSSSAASSASTPTAAKSGWRPPTTRCTTPTTSSTRW